MGITLDSVKEKLLGNKFGKLTVLEYLGKNSWNDNNWRCMCDCGTEVIGYTGQINQPTSACTKCKWTKTLEKDPRRSALLDKVFGRLTVLAYNGSNEFQQIMWKCRCDCGNEVSVRTASLMSRETKSCGCYQREQHIKRITTHGLTNHPLYAVYWAMRERCYNSNCEAYVNYGGRTEGKVIEICDEWLNDFMTFYN